MKFKKSLLLLSLFPVVACSKKIDISNLEGAKLLRSPEDLSLKYDIFETLKDEPKQFKSKMIDYSSLIASSINKDVYKVSENYCVSPLSILNCLSLAFGISTDKTKEEFENSFNFSQEELYKNYPLFYKSMNYIWKSGYGEEGGRIDLYNSIWIDNDVKLKEEGLDTLKNTFYSYAYNVNFGEEKANKAIENYIKKVSRGLLQPDLSFDASTYFVLMNALYIKDLWNDESIDLTFTKDDYTFTNADKSTKNTKLLQGYYNVGKKIDNDYFEAFHTHTSMFSLYFVKPKENVSLKDVFNKENIDTVLNRSSYIIQDDELLERYYTKCIFPEFEVESPKDFNLNKVIKEDLNLSNMYTANNKMKIITDDEIYVTSVDHLAKLKVNKKGIEGAAVTYMATAGAVGPDEYKDVYLDFVVDKEFGFILTYSGVPVFSGVVNYLK